MSDHERGCGPTSNACVSVCVCACVFQRLCVCVMIGQSEDEEDGEDERGFSFLLPRHLYFQSLQSTVSRIYAKSHIPRVINDFGKGVARELRQRFGQEERRDQAIHKATIQILNEGGVDLQHLPVHTLCVYMCVYVCLCVCVHTSRLVTRS